MTHYQLAMELLSPAIFGNGESVNGLVNNEIKYDKEGYPYYSGKTFMGNLRQAATDVLLPYYEQSDATEKANFMNTMRLLFGVSVDEKKGDLEKNGGEGALRIGNFYLESGIQKTIENRLNLADDKKAKKRMVQDALTTVRHATKLENGTAAHGSLRTYREVKGGLVFVSQLSLNLTDADRSDLVYRFLCECLQALKSIGMYKQKGKGAVALKLTELEAIGKTERSNPIKGASALTIRCDWELLEPVKIGDSHKSYDFEKTKAYLTGASIRGAVVASLLKQQLTDEDLEKLLKHMRFSPAYPVTKGYEAFPLSEIFVTTKKAKKMQQDFSLSQLNVNVNDDESVFGRRDILGDDNKLSEKLKSKDFAVWAEEDGSEDKKALWEVGVDTAFHMHHSRQKGEENLFRYEAIERGQQFYSTIEWMLSEDTTEAEGEALIAKVLNCLNQFGQLHVGGSRHAGYGRVKVSAKHDGKLPFEQFESISKQNADTHIVYLMSDAILTDAMGRVGMWEPELLKALRKIQKNKIKEEIVYDGRFVTTTAVTGYNAKWDSKQPQCHAIKAGSVLVFINTTKETIESLMKKYFSTRAQEGFGMYLIDPEFMDCECFIKSGSERRMKANSSNSPETDKTAERLYTLNPNNKAVYQERLSRIMSHIDESIINELTMAYVAKNVEEEALSGALNATQWRQVVNLADEYLSTSSGLPLSKFLNEIKKDRTAVTENEARTLKNRKMLYTPLLGGVNLYKLIEEMGRIQVASKDEKTVFNELYEKIWTSCSSFNACMDIDFERKYKERLLLLALRNTIYYSMRKSSNDFTRDNDIMNEEDAQ